MAGVERTDVVDRELDLADTFAKAYDQLAAGDMSDIDPLTFISWRSNNEAVIQEIDDLARRRAALPAALVEEYGGSAELIFVLMLGIDSAFATIDPRRGSGNEGRMSRYRLRLDRRHTYSTDAVRGHVLPRLTQPGRPRPVEDHWSECLHSLIRVKSMPKGIDYTRCDPEWDFRPAAGGIGIPEFIKVAVVPFIGSLDELTIRPIEKVRSWYEIFARQAPFWEDRITEILAKLDTCGAVLAVLPELSLNDEILRLWSSALESTPRPAGGRLQWLLVGSGPVRSAGGNIEHEQPPNRAVVLERDSGLPVELPTPQSRRNGRGSKTGEPHPFVQDKCRGFALRPAQLRAWNLTQWLGEDRTRAEWMRRGLRRLIVETNIGRLTVLICEDHGRLFREGARISRLEPSLILVPIFSQPIRRYFWEERAAGQYLTEVGATVIVANSCAVADPTPGRFETCSSLMIHSAEGNDGEQAAHGVPRHAVAPDDLMIFDVPLTPV